jgi:hypothetical protein
MEALWTAGLIPYFVRLRSSQSPNTESPYSLLVRVRLSQLPNTESPYSLLVRLRLSQFPNTESQGSLIELYNNIMKVLGRPFLWLFVLFIIIYIGFAKENLNNNNNKNGNGKVEGTIATNQPNLHWMFVHHHKTGVEFTSSIRREIYKECNIPEQTEVPISDSGYALSHKNFTDFFQNYMRTSMIDNYIYRTDGTAFVGNWKTAFAYPNIQYRIIHMIRDPFEIVLSAYKYHIQMPPPEQWIKYPEANVCFYMKRHMQSIELLGKVHGGIHEVIQWFEHMHHTCNLARSTFLPRASYQQMLNHSINIYNGKIPVHNKTALDVYKQSFPPASAQYLAVNKEIDLYPAIRIEAFRCIPQILDMAVTKLFEDTSMAMSMHLEDFGQSNETQFRQAANKMASFLLKNRNQYSGDLVKCLNVPTAVDVIQRGGYLSPEKIQQKSTHITKSAMSTEMKKMYIERLASDPVLGHFLRFASRVVNTPTPKSSHTLFDNPSNIIKYQDPNNVH